MIKIIGVGDIMPGGLLNDSAGPCANEEILNILLQGDVRCGTLECALGNEPTYDKEKMIDKGDGIYSNVIYAKDADVRRLKELHINVVSLANNHFFDLGEAGALHTIELLDREGVLHCGAGRNLKEAGAPVVLDIKGKRVAFLAFCDTNYKNVFYCTYATEDLPGVNPMKENYVVSEIKKYATQYDYVIVLAHWGTENTFNPNVSSVKMAEMMLKAGACLVLGSHPHQIQPVINSTYYPDEPIDYSKLPVTDGYPIVGRVTLKTLPYWARVGQIVKSQICNNSVISAYRFSYLNKDNCLTLLDERKSEEANTKLEGLSWLLKMRLYKPYMFVCRVFNSIRVRLKRLMR